MAAPATINTTSLSGVWVMNKTLSDDTSDMLAAQSIGWMLRKSIALATITLYIKHTTDSDTGLEHIDIDSTLSGLKGTTEKRTLDWTERTHEDYVFGKVIAKSRRIQLSEIDDDVLKKGWTEDTIAKGLIQSHGKNVEYEWTVDQIWGFMEINGERRYARRVKFTTPKVRLDKVIVYDYYSPLEESQ